MGNGRNKVQILYNVKTDLLYIRLDDQKQPVINKRVSEDIVLDIGEGDKIVGIEILDASQHLSLESCLLPTSFLSRHIQRFYKRNLPYIGWQVV
jgi:uncharacterized protein YuzE